jgi:beta-lactamase class D
VESSGATATAIDRVMLVTTNATLVVTLLTSSIAVADRPDLAQVFAGRDGCFELYDLNAKKLVVRSDARRCAERVSPCSTFKVPLALMAFDAGVLTDERSSIKWDGQDRGRDVWNRDQTAASWMHDSVVWFSQRLTPQLGMERVRRYLARFGFGNGDMSGGITTAWLDSSLKISADEQLRFWERFWRGDLPVSRQAIETTKKITLVDTSTMGWTLHGKTGSGRIARAISRGHEFQHGWFVGHIARGAQEYVFATAYSDRFVPKDGRPAGWIARDLTKQILGALGLY